jgi:hypothetical protein
LLLGLGVCIAMDGVAALYAPRRLRRSWAYRVVSTTIRAAKMSTRPASPTSGGRTIAAGSAATSTPIATSRGRLRVLCMRCLNSSSPARYTATPPNSAAP